MAEFLVGCDATDGTGLGDFQLENQKGQGT